MNADQQMACAQAVVACVLRELPVKQIGIYDTDDIRQELLLSALNGAARHDGREHIGYVFTCVRNAVRDLRQFTCANSRMPKDKYGRPQAHAHPDVLEFQTTEASDPEQQAAVRQALQRLLEQCERGEAVLDEQVKTNIRYVLSGGT